MALRRPGTRAVGAPPEPLRDHLGEGCTERGAIGSRRCAGVAARADDAVEHGRDEPVAQHDRLAPDLDHERTPGPRPLDRGEVFRREAVRSRGHEVAEDPR